MSEWARGVGLVLVLVLLIVGCASNDSEGTVGAADCTGQVRLDGAVYTSHGYAELSGSKHAAADAAECRDVGRRAPGSVFPDDPRQVSTWTFAGYSMENVVGVRIDADSFEVFVADGVPVAGRERILRELQGRRTLRARSVRRSSR